MGLRWRKMVDEKPKHAQDCLVKMKHGIVQGCYDEDDGQFSIYLWRNIDFYGTEWVPVEEAS